MRLLKSLEITLVIIYTLLFIYDYFPDFPLGDPLSAGVLSGIIVGLILLSLFFKEYRNPTNKDILIWELFIFIYTLFLIALLTVLGGKSSVGLSFDNGFFRVLVLVAVFEIYFRWRKVNRA